MAHRTNHSTKKTARAVKLSTEGNRLLDSMHQFWGTTRRKEVLERMLREEAQRLQQYGFDG